jgi:glycosyltransferase involved in cell wall biosynthesis
VEKRVKIAFTMLGGDGWMGGRVYFNNLLTAIHRQEDRLIEPVILVGENVEADLSGFPPVDLIRTPLLNSSASYRYLRKGVTRLFGQDILFERFLRSRDISVLSHSGHLGPRATIGSIAWIADLQTIHFPEFTAPKSRERSERTHREWCDYCTKVIVSSECGRKDMARFSPANAGKSEILRFVAAPFSQGATPIAELQLKYNFNGGFFLLPNQFWAHKNHRTVITALSILKKSGTNLTVLATGWTKDARHPGHFDSLMDYARECGVLDQFRVLGAIPFPDLVGLFEASWAIMNPSLFEGWSTSVEEAKSMGKTIILSDIPVHREQNPERGVYFSTLDPEDLARALLRVRDRFDLRIDMDNCRRALSAYPARQREFARRYQDIAISAII